MNSWPDTESTLVRRLSDPRDDVAWNRFDVLYGPIVYRYARLRGLQHSDAETLVGEVMSRVFRAARRWSDDSAALDAQSVQGAARPERFRAWLSRVAENALLNLVTRQLSRRGTGGTSHQLFLSGRVVPDQASRDAWERQHREQLFMAAASVVQRQVDADHWSVFWKTHVEGVEIDRVADETGRTIGSVYAIRSRIVRRLRQTVQRVGRLESQTAEEMP